MNIILDDDLVNRPTPSGFKRFTTGNDLMQFMLENPNIIIDEITFDNDLGRDLPEGYDVVKQMVLDHWNVNKINIHSANIVAVSNMISFIKSAKRVQVFNYTSLTDLSLANYIRHLSQKSKWQGILLFFFFKIKIKDIN